MRIFPISIIIFQLIVGFYVLNLLIIEKQKELVIEDKAYVKGFEAALDCRALLSAPSCEIVLEKAGK